MHYSKMQVAGVLLFVAATQFVFGAIFAEALDSSYKFEQPIMFLGSGSAAAIYNSSIFLLGTLMVVSAIFIWKGNGNKLFIILLAITGIAFAAVSVVGESAGVFHVLFVRTFMIFSVPTVLLSYKLLKSPFSFVVLVLGFALLASVFLFNAGAYVSPSFYLGISRGAMQRLIIYPIVIWMLGFGSFLLGNAVLDNKSSKVAS